MTLEEIRTAVQVWLLNRPEAVSSLIDPVVNKIYLSMAMPFRFHETETEHLLSTVAGTREYALSTGIMYALKEAYNRQYGDALDVVDVNEVDTHIDYDTIEGRPRKIARFGSVVRFDIAPDFTETDIIILRGLSLPTKLVNDTDEPVYPEDWHWIIELQSASICSFMLGMEDRGQMLQNMALGQITGRQEAHTLEAFTKQMQLMAGTYRKSTSKPEIR